MRTLLPLSRTIAFACVVLIAGSCGGTAASPAPSTSGSTSDPGASDPSVSASPEVQPALVWPAPPDPLERTGEAGLEPAPKEYLVNHVHAHLDVFIDGAPILVPAGVGINTEDPGVRRFEDPIGYGGIEMCDQPCISPLHTHDESGILHTESSDPEPHTLGQFFVEWGVELSETCIGGDCTKPIAVYIGGEPYDGDPGEIELTDTKVIVLVVGTPPAEIPSTADFSEG